MKGEFDLKCGLSESSTWNDRERRVRFEVTSMISKQIARHEVQLPVLNFRHLENRFLIVNKI